ncbi:Splicing factor 3A subunit 3 [Auxenochlorella protothecoides]|uniref:Splicing factor 3A subunit 3 n=1 Tax=Auxenochlorella protothecoides TaxID=3075 RepID=A0A087SEV3_AUXPR|nr:Splicing factor 3A subunit 3 [Auxenochlorella protothecoides]KFM24257.1 Splicing factor 3A subunit 3 [Auxenochlorella protothecoides]RMZ56197.1 hypothetical protein APUTEX25_002387 [Auxenochlorella protothecoides]|eukprot:RMZ56197.1 hypothetical protein APUTEX25_002387 [Auxenochlorella protothecoides]
MATTLLENTRQQHEDMERLERLIVKDFRTETKTYKDKLLQSHRVRGLLDALQSRAAALVDIYKDEDESRKQDIAALRGADPISTFYDRLKEVRAYHRRFPSEDITEGDGSEALLAAAEPAVAFSGEEALGRYLDLHELHAAHSNGAFAGQPLDYHTYVLALADWSRVARPARTSRAYREYLERLAAYLESFHARTQPLADLDAQMRGAVAEFEEAWARGAVPGWEDRGAGGAAAAGGRGEVPEGALDLDAFDSVDELELLGGQGLGARVSRLLRLLGTVHADTAGRVEKRQAQTYEELLAEQAEAEEEGDLVEEDSDEEAPIYNPLKLPLGWDGKPIPFWLYRLHGLNIEFKCEICGGASYWGRRAFERHFKEPQHQRGLKTLGVPWSREFYEITSIADALALWKSMRERQRSGAAPGTEEEFEDDAGNVYNKKTWEDLRRQGLV